MDGFIHVVPKPDYVFGAGQLQGVVFELTLPIPTFFLDSMTLVEQVLINDCINSYKMMNGIFSCAVMFDLTILPFTDVDPAGTVFTS